MNNSLITHTTPEDAQRTFLAFREECIWLRICYNTYADLYESGDQVIETLSVTANIFFGDLSRILSEYFCLQACKITDPEKTCGKPNLTVDHINVLLRESNLMTDHIDRYSSELHHYRDLVVGARNRLIAHSDREAVLKGLTLGMHTKQEMEAFVENLQLYCDAVGRTVGTGPLNFCETSGPGDVLDLIGFLQEVLKARKARKIARFVSSVGM